MPVFHRPCGFPSFKSDERRARRRRELSSSLQVLIDGNHLHLSSLSYIWSSLAVLLFFTSFAFLDWTYARVRLPYQFNIELESTDQNDQKPFWKYLVDPFYILIVLFLSFVILPTVFLAVVWKPSITWMVHGDAIRGEIDSFQSLSPSVPPSTSSADRYTFAYNVSSISSVLICPLTGYILGYKSDRSNTVTVWEREREKDLSSRSRSTTEIVEPLPR